jgi:opacity protein-like surface antigen
MWDRAGHERGVRLRARLLIDLTKDLVVTSLTWTPPPPVLARTDGMPRFDILRPHRPRPEALAAGTLTSILMLASFALLILIGCHAPDHAQTPAASGSSGAVGFFIQRMSPRGAFAENTRDADRGHQGGLGVHLTGHVNSFVTFRLEYFFGSYEKNACYCSRYLFRAVGVAGELVSPRGPVRPYATAGLGRLSISSFEDADGNEADTGAGYRMYGGGLRIPAGNRWSIDLAWRHHEAGPVSYQHLQRNPDGSSTETSARTRTPFDMLTLGFQFRVGGS